MSHAVQTFDMHDLKRSTLATVPEDKAFWVCRGDRIRNIHDLANCIESLTLGEFHYHVNAATHTNHFAQWIESTLHNPRLAHDLNFPVNLQDQKHFVKTIRDHVRWLEHS
jgi:hypothetical protein